MRDYPNVDYQCDIRDLPEEWENSIEQAYASQVLEHFDGEGIASVLEEVSRILEPGGEFVFDVPYGRAHNPDPTHQTRWYFQTIAYFLPRDEVVRLGWNPETYPEYYADYDITLELTNRDAIAWLDVDSTVLRPVSYGVRQASQRVTTDKWDALPLIGGLTAGVLKFHLQQPNGK